MASKIIFMDGITTAHLRDDGSIRIELEAAHTNAYESSLARIPAAIRRARPLEVRPPSPNGPVLDSGAEPRTERAL